MGQDFVDDMALADEGDNLHGGEATGTKEGIGLIDETKESGPASAAVFEPVRIRIGQTSRGLRFCGSVGLSQDSQGAPAFLRLK